MTARARQPGEFCWINIVTPKPADARAFFSALLGWTYGEIPGAGHTILVGGSAIGGIFDLAAPNVPPGTKPMIGVMIKVENAEAIAAKVKQLGGKATAPRDIMGNLRMGECHDPTGARFDTFEPVKQQGTDVDSSQRGATCWFEVLTPDVARAKAFYTALFGWTTEDMPSPGGTYTVIKRNGEGMGGMFQIAPGMGMEPTWMPYFVVTNADDAGRDAAKLGGSVWMPARDIPGGGRMVGLTSPQGIMFYGLEPPATRR